MSSIISDFFNSIIALEADITDEVEKEKEKAIGKPSITPGVNKDDEKDDISKTDDIFGIKDDNKPANKNKTMDNDADNEEDDADDPSLDEGVDSEDNELGDTEDSDAGIDELEPDSDTQEKRQLQKLKENMILFHGVITNNIELLRDYAPKITDADSNKIVYNITANLSECKRILFVEITEGFDKKSYAELMKKYVAINRVYDLCIMMLSKHFDNLDLIEVRKNKRKTK